MIYITNSTDPQNVFVPKDTSIASGTFAFTVQSTVDLSTVSATIGEVTATNGYYNFYVTLPEGVQDGEYEYHLTVNGQEAGSGIMVVGETLATPVPQYEKSITYEQYEAE